MRGRRTVGGARNGPMQESSPPKTGSCNGTLWLYSLYVRTRGLRGRSLMFVLPRPGQLLADRDLLGEFKTTGEQISTCRWFYQVHDASYMRMELRSMLSAKPNGKEMRCIKRLT